MKLPSIFRTSEGEVGLGVILPLESFQFPKGTSWDDRLISPITGRLMIEFRQSKERKGYNACRFTYLPDSSLTKEMSPNERRKVFEIEISDGYARNSVRNLVQDATGFRFRKFYISNRFNKAKNYFDQVVCVLMYLE